MDNERKLPLTPTAPSENWRELMEKAVKERDLLKLIQKVRTRCDELEERLRRLEQQAKSLQPSHLRHSQRTRKKG